MLETREVRYIPQNVKASVNTDVGCVREVNEDSGRHLIPNDLETQNKRGYLTVVADGMGGHASGEVASQMAVDFISEYYYADQSETVAEALKNAIQFANEEIYETSLTDEKYFGMGTTVISLVLLDKIGYAAHVGDSRLYRLRGENFEQMTMDHSQVMEMYKQGIISWEDTKNHEDKNVILRAVGTQKNVEVEVSEPFEIEPNDEYLLCSDGLCDMLDDEEIRQIWLASKDIHSTTENLIQRAKENGGHDNITVAIVKAESETMQFKEVRATRETEVFQ
ncbi:MAG: Stp1/IreP family PP2C-type Ser/Thr phosphatase [Pyrinomonadaceae bacterium]|nr:Stp1/IreP family PP2C-type Ser/Thr phosphatase [Pyrinomonadaceae bacterium]